MLEREAPAIDLEPRLRIGSPDQPELCEEERAELSEDGVALAELLEDGCPRYELRPTDRDAVQALGEPAIDVERH